MYLRRLVSVLSIASLGVVFGHAASPPPGGPPLSSWIPEQAALCLEVLRPERLLDALLSPAFAERIQALPAYAQRKSSRQLQDLRGLVQFLEASTQTNWPSIVRKLTRQGAAFAVGGENRHLLIVRGDDPALLDKIHTIARQIAASEAEKQGLSDQVRSAEHAGLTGWTFNGKEAHAVAADCLLAGSDAEVLKLAAELRAGSGGSLAGRTAYQEARQAVGAAADALLFVDLEQLRMAPGWAAALDQPTQNPLAALLLAGVTTTLKSAPWLALGFYVEGADLRVSAFAGGEPGTAAVSAFAKPTGGAKGAPESLVVPRQIASLNLHRDLAGFYAAKDELFPQRTSGLIFFENMMGIFFTGRNLTDEVLAQTQPDLRLVVARQQYDPAMGTPEPQLPGFALVIGLRDPKAFGEVLEEAWQKALGLVNFTRGQKAEPGLILDREDHGGTPITVSRFSAKEVPDREHLDIRFNFRPSLALAGGHAILSSTDQLARDLVDGLRKPAPASTTSADAHTRLELRGNELSGLLKANRASLVRNNMLKEGTSQTDAETAIDTLCGLAGWVDQARLEVGGGRQSQAFELRLSFRKP